MCDTDLHRRIKNLASFLSLSKINIDSNLSLMEDNSPKRTTIMPIDHNSLTNLTTQTFDDEAFCEEILSDDNDEEDEDIDLEEEADNNAYSTNNQVNSIDSNLNTLSSSERLKAFNMFVRLYVDRNLDRLVPISRQPKEKIQAIIDSCVRQFPEFSERARKRIRTYLKSCRRNRRLKGIASQVDQTSHSTSYHLSSPLAEQHLKNACDNESNNAKRIQVGMEPSFCFRSHIEPEMLNNQHNTTNSTGSSTSNHNNNVKRALSPTLKTNNSQNKHFKIDTANDSLSPLGNPLEMLKQMKNSGLQDIILNSSVILRPGQSTSNDASATHSKGHYSLNHNELAAVKQLISGYRESAAFLMRFADELEQLIHSS